MPIDLTRTPKIEEFVKGFEYFSCKIVEEEGKKYREVTTHKFGEDSNIHTIGLLKKLIQKGEIGVRL